ncbi:MAG: class I SAM-dependent methyltransferase [Nitrospinota bacterium]|nr:class I SAM-dependent methyltransferase [Nitrospinota bacterium]
MKPETIRLLQDPATASPLSLEPALDPNANMSGWLVSQSTGRRYRLTDGVPSFLEPEEVTGLNLRYQKMYDRIALGYDLAEWIGGFFWGGGVKTRLEILRDVIPAAAGKVLEVSIGTGANLRYLPRSAEYYGLDISMGMLHKCQRNLARWSIETELFHGAAEALPFVEDAFDMVFHFGGINFFTDPARAALELMRVAKPGGMVFFGDETEDMIKLYQKSPFLSRYYKDNLGEAFDPVALVPAGAMDVKKKTLKDGKFYMVGFRKPLS